jgi:hypothetical protein
MEIIATAFGKGSKHDFRLFKENYAGMAQEQIQDISGSATFMSIVRYLLRNRNFILSLLSRKLLTANWLVNAFSVNMSLVD